MKVEVIPDAKGVALRAAGWLPARAREAVAARGRFVVAVSGGSTPWQMLRALSSEELGAVTGAPAVLDVVHLGLGSDGHTASLVPGDPVLEVNDADVATTGVYAGRRRMTLTYPVLDRARRILWVITGADKSPVLPRLMAGDHAIPAGRVRAARATLLADAAAASHLPEPAR